MIADRLPDDSILVCSKADEGKRVQLVHFDRTKQAEVLLDAWSGRILVWNGGPRSGRRVKDSARRQFRFGVAVFIVLMIPAFAFSIWFGFQQHWGGFIFGAFVLLTNFVTYLLLLPDYLAEPVVEVVEAILD
ncbi:hypothetical protein ACTG9Q_28845 [Actinokineospora sp. 24-640]